jgi:hypothetical protein
MTFLTCRPVDLSAAPRRSYVGEGPEATAQQGVCVPNLRSVENLTCYTVNLYLLRDGSYLLHDGIDG